MRQESICLWSDCKHRFKPDIEHAEMTPKRFEKHLQHATSTWKPATRGNVYGECSKKSRVTLHGSRVTCPARKFWLAQRTLLCMYTRSIAYQAHGQCKPACIIATSMTHGAILTACAMLIYTGRSSAAEWLLWALQDRCQSDSHSSTMCTIFTPISEAM